MKFLVADDDPAIRSILTELLQGFGHEVIEAKSAEEALDILSEQPIEFIISDWNMAGMSGIEFLSAVRSDPRTKAIPFIIITVPTSDEIQRIETAVEGQVDAYVIKPFRGEVLNAKIMEVLSKKKDASVSLGGVLIADDEEQARKVIVEIVETLGHKPIFQAANGDDAFTLLKKHIKEISLVISDWEMPTITGNMLLRKIRKDKNLAHIPFIMVTSQTSMEQLKLKEAIDAKVSHYLMKPFTIKDLEEKIDIVLSKAVGNPAKSSSALKDAAKALQDGRTDEARSIYREVLKTDPKSIPALLGFADTYLRSGEDKSFDEAVGLMEKAIQVAPKLDVPRIALALAYEHAKSLDRALQHLQEGATRIPNSASIKFQLGRISLRRGNKEQAVAFLNQALKLNPGLEEARQLLAEAKTAKSKEKKSSDEEE